MDRDRRALKREQSRPLP